MQWWLPEMVKEGYQIRAHIIEARALKGTDEGKGFSVNPITRVRLTAGDGPTLVDKSKYTTKAKETNSVFWDEVRIFQEELSRDQFNSGKLEICVEDVGLISNSPIGSAFFDLTTIYEYPSHEIFGKWVALMDDKKGNAVQGFVRLSVTCLREGDTPKIHALSELDEEQESETSMVMNMPDLETVGFLLVVRINRVEVAKFGLSKPTMQVRHADCCRHGYRRHPCAPAPPMSTATGGILPAAAGDPPIRQHRGQVARGPFEL